MGREEGDKFVVVVVAVGNMDGGKTGGSCDCSLLELVGFGMASGRGGVDTDTGEMRSSAPERVVSEAESSCGRGGGRDVGGVGKDMGGAGTEVGADGAGVVTGGCIGMATEEDI